MTCANRAVCHSCLRPTEFNAHCPQIFDFRAPPALETPAGATRCCLRMVSPLQYYGINQYGRDFVVGDLHGCIVEFEALLLRVGFDYHTDRVFSVGDLVDRGPNSMECLRLLNEPWFHAVMGNHEDMMLNAVSGNLRNGADHWASNGGDWGIERFEDGDPEFFDLAELVDALPYAISVKTKELGIIGISHAEPPSEWTDSCVDLEMNHLLWSRKKIFAPANSLTKGGVDFSVHGHTITKTVTMRDDLRAFWIDLGCYSTGRLCALQVSGDGVNWPLENIYS